MSKYSGQIRCKKFCSYNAARQGNMYRLAPVRYTTFDRNYFVEMAANDAGITEEQMNAALRAYQTQFDQLLLNGHSIEMAGLGNFRLSMSFKAHDNLEDINIDEDFERLRVVLRCSKDLRDDMKSIRHIVDPMTVAASGNSVNRQHFYLNYQLPAAKEQSGITENLRIYTLEGLINLSSLGDLWFLVDDPEFGPAKLTYDATSGTSPTWKATVSGHEYEIVFTNGGTYLDIDEMNGFSTLKAFGGR